MKIHRSPHLAFIFGSVSFLLGALVMLAWHASLPFMIQIKSTLFSMPYNTALGFLFSSLGLILVNFSKTKLGGVLGTLVAVLGGLTLFEYLLGIHLGIDELIIKDYIHVKTSHPGRMAPNTALSFFLFGASLLLWNKENKGHKDIFCIGILGSIIFALALVALSGYLSGLEGTYGWGDFRGMAIHTSLGFIFLSLGIIGLAWNVSTDKAINIPSWFSCVIFIGGIVAAILLWQAQIEDIREDIKAKIKLKAERLKSLMLTELESQSLALTRMGKRLEVNGSLSATKWTADAENFLSHNSGYQSIELWDTSYKPIIAVLNKSMYVNQYSPPLGQNYKFIESLKRARKIKSLTTSPVINLYRNERVFSVNIPISSDDAINSFVLGIFHTDKFMRKILDTGPFPDLLVSILEGKNKFYQSGKDIDQIQTEWGYEIVFKFYDISWKIQILPVRAWLKEEKTNISNALLIQGILMAFLLSLAIHLFRKERIQKYHAMDLHKKNINEMGKRLRVQKTLSESESRFKVLVERMNDGLAAQDENGNLTFVNAKFCDIFGYSREEILGKPLSCFVGKEKVGNGQGKVDFKRWGGIRPYESSGIKKDKTHVYLIVAPEKIVDSSGQIKGSFCVITDVTELKVIQENLVNQKKELDIILNSVPAMIWFKDKENKILRANRSAAESVGLNLKNIVGQSAFELFPWEAKQYLDDDLEVINTGRPKLGIVEIYRTKSNEKRWVQTDKIPYWDELDEIKGVIVFSVDITAQKNAQDELNKYKGHLEALIEQRQKELIHSESRFKQIIFDAPIPIMVHDERGDVLMISRRWSELSGYLPREISTVGNWINIAYGEKRAGEIQQGISKIFDSNQLSHQGEFEINTASGDKRTWDFFSKPFMDLKENRKYAVSMAVDVTDRINAELLLRESQAQLLHSEKLSAIGKLSASIAHEFNNPIYGIRNVLEMVAEEVPMDRSYEEFIDLAVKECNRMKDLILKLQDFHRPTSDVITLIDINKLIDETSLWVNIRLNEKKIKLKKEFDECLPRIPGVFDQIKQVILNLLQNAEAAMPLEGGVISIITISYASVIKIVIQDSGVGIDAEHIKKIFEPFYTNKSLVSSTGLGLYLSYGIIKRHGGDIEVVSQQGHGTQFTISIPTERDP